MLVYLEKEPGWEDVAELLAVAARSRVRLSTTTVNWGEVYYTTRREYGPEKTGETIRLIDGFPIERIDAEITSPSGGFRFLKKETTEADSRVVWL